MSLPENPMTENPVTRTPVTRRLLLGGAVAGAAALTPAGRSMAAEPTGATSTADTRQKQYADAAARYGVPESVLLGVSYLMSRWDTNGGTPSTSGGYGPMHLTDAAYVAALPNQGTHHSDVDEDPRGDDSRAVRTTQPVDTEPAPVGLQSLDQAAELTGATREALRMDPVANILGGAALLNAYQRELGGPVGSASDPAAWYGAVARYIGPDSAEAAAVFADEVFATIASGAARTTDDGQAMVLPASRVEPTRSWLDRLGLRHRERADGVEAPRDVSAEWVPAPYQELPDNDYGNHDLGDRPRQQRIQYIVIHDTEGPYDVVLRLATDPTYVSWHYTLRSIDGHIAQHVPTKDVAWHAGNWYVNAKAIGLEHEGYAAKGTWYTEAMYRSSAKLVRYLALRFGIPLDREHIIGHDNVPGILPAYVRGMHWDTGPYWDWGHYFDLLKAPFRTTGTARTGLVTIDPDLRTNMPAFTGCVTAGVACAPRGSSAVILHTAPAHDAPLVTDIGRNPNPATMAVADHGARASAGQRFAVAGRDGDWTAIWYLGQVAWFHNPRSAPTAKWATGLVVTPKPGLASIPVYGRAYPEQAAYPPGVPYQAVTPLQYTFPAGQRYAAGAELAGEYYRSTTFDGSSPGDHTVIRGTNRYVQIQFGHRIMFVNRADVVIRPSC